MKTMKIKDIQVKKQKYIDELAEKLKKDGISFQETDGEYENSVFQYQEKTKKIAHRIIYRYSGMCVTYKDDGRSVVMEPFTDELFYDYMYNLIKYLFNL